MGAGLRFCGVGLKVKGLVSKAEAWLRAGSPLLYWAVAFHVVSRN